MGYNDPMRTEPVNCECGLTPHVLSLGDRPDKFRNHHVVFCTCGLSGSVVPDGLGAIFFWGLKHQREAVKEPWLSELTRAANAIETPST